MNAIIYYLPLLSGTFTGQQCQDNCKYVYFYMHLFPLPWSPINQLKAVKKIATDCVFAKVLSQNQAAE